MWVIHVTVPWTVRNWLTRDIQNLKQNSDTPVPQCIASRQLHSGSWCFRKAQSHLAPVALRVKGIRAQSGPFITAASSFSLSSTTLLSFSFSFRQKWEKVTQMCSFLEKNSFVHLTNKTNTDWLCTPIKDGFFQRDHWPVSFTEMHTHKPIVHCCIQSADHTSVAHWML